MDELGGGGGEWQGQTGMGEMVRIPLVFGAGSEISAASAVDFSLTKSLCF